MPRRTPEGAIGMFSTFIAYQFGVAVLLAMAFAAAFGWFMERFTLRPLRERRCSPA